MLWFKNKSNLNSFPSFSPDPIFVFLAGFLFIFAFYVGFPFDFTQDYLEVIQYANNFSFTRLIALTINPFTPGWFFIDDIVYLRPLTILFFKLNEHIFGIGATSFIVVEAISCGILSVLFFHLIVKAGNSKLYGWLAIFLYLSFPPIFFSTMSFPHMEYLNTLLRFSSVIIFGYLTLNYFRSLPKFVITCIGWYVLTLLSIKLRSSDKLLVPVFIAFLLFNFKPVIQKIGRSRFFFIGLVSLLMLLSVVPIQIKAFSTTKQVSFNRAEQKEKQIRTVHIQNLHSSIVHNPQGENPFATVFKDKPPQSVTENYGFFLGWFFWIFLCTSFFFLVKNVNAPSESERIYFLKHFFKLTSVLTGILAVTFMSDFISADLRYLSFILTPSLLLLMWGILLFEYYLKGDKKFFIFRAIMIGSFVFTIGTNLGFYLKYLGHFGGGMTYGFVEAAKKVYEDKYQRKPVGHELYLEFPKLYGRNLLIEWHDSFKDNMKQLGARDLRSTYYVLSRNQNPEIPSKVNSARIALGDVNFLDAPPVVFRVLKAVRSIKNKQDKDKIFIYKIVPAST